MSDRTRIIFVDDEPCVLSGLERMLFDREDEWEMGFVSSGKEAIAAFEAHPFDVIVTDMRMPEMDGAQLLLVVQERWPASVRIILSGQAEKEAVLRSIGPSHRFLPKPCDSEILYATISKARQLHAGLCSPKLKELVASQMTLPSMPRLYNLLLNEMQTQEPSLERVADLISQDVSMSCKLLQIVNSTLQGSLTELNSTIDVVRAIGIERLRPLVLSAGIFSHFPDMPFLEDQNEQFVAHSATVSRLAQAIVELELPGNVGAAGVALLGGLVHDVGKLILGQGFGAEYQKIVVDSHIPSQSMLKLERERLGVDHVAVGAYLMGLWGIPDTIVEVVAHHHLPSLNSDDKFSPTTAVHVADALDHVYRFGGEEDLDMLYLERIGVVNKLPRWRDLLPKNQQTCRYPAIVDGSRVADLALSSSASS